KNRYTTSFTHDITINGLWFTTLGGNYLWLACLQLNLCHARHTIKQAQTIDLCLYTANKAAFIVSIYYSMLRCMRS
ncbi:hypothetical protein MKC77_02865, partial [[Clostridium] innocuum]|nr:hypothetical protein [[Clostridium] innocuum]